MKLSDELKQYMREMARKGGKARAKQLSAEQRRAIAKKGAAARWKGRKP